MILLGSSTQALMVDVWLHFGPAGNQFLHKGSVLQDISDFIHQLLKECRHLQHQRA